MIRSETSIHITPNSIIEPTGCCVHAGNQMSISVIVDGHELNFTGTRTQLRDVGNAIDMAIDKLARELAMEKGGVIL